MNCSQCQDVLVEYSLGELDRADADQVDAHLASGCEVCRHECNELQDVLAMLGASLAPVSPELHVKQELLARIQNDATRYDVARGAEGPTSAATIPFVAAARPRRLVWKVLPYAAAVLCGFLVGALATQYYADDGFLAAAREAQFTALVESARQKFGSPQIHFAALHRAEDEGAVVGHLMWDARGRSLHFFAFDLQPPAEGQQFVVWYETGEGKAIHAGELAVSARGACSAVFDAPQLDESITAIIVTEEPVGEVAAPHGPQQIVARFEQPGGGAE